MEFVRHVLTHANAPLGVLIFNSKGCVVHEDADARSVLGARRSLAGKHFRDLSLPAPLLRRVERMYRAPFSLFLNEFDEGAFVSNGTQQFCASPIQEVAEKEGGRKRMKKRVMVLVSNVPEKSKRVLQPRQVESALALFGAWNGKRLGGMWQHHFIRTLGYADQLAKALDYSPPKRLLVRVGALFHDIGKLETPDAILNKPGAFTAGERKIMDRHWPDGRKMMERVGFRGVVVRPILETLEHHNTAYWQYRAKGAGTPAGATPSPLEIVQVADYFDACTTDRPYRGAMHVRKALSEMQADLKNEYFHPRAFHGFVRALGLEKALLKPSRKSKR